MLGAGRWRMNGEAECPADLEMTAPKNQGEAPLPHWGSHGNATTVTLKKKKKVKTPRWHFCLRDGGAVVLTVPVGGFVCPGASSAVGVMQTRVGARTSALAKGPHKLIASGVLVVGG